MVSAPFPRGGRVSAARGRYTVTVQAGRVSITTGPDWQQKPFGEASEQIWLISPRVIANYAC